MCGVKAPRSQGRNAYPHTLLFLFLFLFLSDMQHSPSLSALPPLSHMDSVFVYFLFHHSVSHIRNDAKILKRRNETKPFIAQQPDQAPDPGPDIVRARMYLSVRCNMYRNLGDRWGSLGAPTTTITTVNERFRTIDCRERGGGRWGRWRWWCAVSRVAFVRSCVRAFVLVDLHLHALHHRERERT